MYTQKLHLQESFQLELNSYFVIMVVLNTRLNPGLSFGFFFIWTYDNVQRLYLVSEEEV